MSVQGIVSAAGNVDPGKVVNTGFGLYGAFLGISATAALVLPIAGFALAMGVNGNTGKPIEGVVPIVLKTTAVTIVVGGIAGGLGGSYFVPFVLNGVQAALNSLAK